MGILGGLIAYFGLCYLMFSEKPTVGVRIMILGTFLILIDIISKHANQ